MDDFLQWLVFGSKCGGVALVLILMDWLSVSLKRKEGRSVLGVSYKTQSLRVVATWALGSFGVGFLSQLLSVIQPTPQGMLAVSVGWPALLTQIADTGTTAGATQMETEEQAENLNEDPEVLDATT